MNEVIERAAGAAFEKQAQRDGEGIQWDDLPDQEDSPGSECKQMWREIARAVIEAMREPTAAMVDAPDPHGLIRANFATAWEAMIDEALR